MQEDRMDAILVDTEYNGKYLQKFELFSESYYAVFPLNHRFNNQKTVRLEELCKEPLIIHQSPCDTRKHIIKQMDSLGQKPNILNELDFSDFILGSVSSGMGVTIVPELIANNIGHLNLSALPITNFGRNRTISLLSKNERLGLKLHQTLTKNYN
ncbi:LysR family transcriptional regulator substrate-binding protein [Aneurinibacillus thermoaerophilus]|uniref:LysR family transcriptional regulator substrate-binding protein n=1 Tax=Aneurinibacillus thermoaerophilus TaxID=143495 RepID=UPI002E1FC393|nr:LysR family transcriptional regulator substrate-binding protein [Aneurinibacillus thermoaerophilus]MED0764835.1 LysR family transcriptional regulator substrate-binding protein [Aneurinibacillus thermoaerophilus]